MKKALISKFISIIFVFATLMASTHHHDDFKSHADCQICTIETTLSLADTPVDVFYLGELYIINEAVVGFLDDIVIQKEHYNFSARAPPFFS